MSKLKSEIRKAYFLNKYVIITPGRERRPRDIKDEEVVKKSGQCPFCPENLDKKRIIDKLGQAGGKTGKVVCVKNLYPAVTLDNPRAYGTQEVIIETLDHQKEMADLSEKQIELILKMFARRTVALEKIKNINYILCFKNQGPKSGASLDHAHSQVLATKIAPENLKEEARAMMEYRAKNKTCPYCDIIKKETRSPRKIWENKTAACFAPYASEYHYEAWIFPKRHLDNIADLKKKNSNRSPKS
jgi:UDPglucose--hexose-1-phosphate uridylyltransferase